MSEQWEPFRYGETTRNGRSLGTNLISTHDNATARGIEEFARAAQGAEWPSHWPPSEAFASVLLADGRRLLAVGRYGLRDSTPDCRPGAVEVVGIVGPEGITPEEAMATRVWCRRRLNLAGELPARVDLKDVVEEVGELADRPQSRPAPPLTPNGLALFTATEPDEPDRRWLQMVGTLPLGTQWIPWLSDNFPVADYTARGPLVGFTPNSVPPSWHLHVPAAPPLLGAVQPPRRRAGLIWLAVFGFLAINAWAWWTVDSRWRKLAAEAKPAAVPLAQPVATKDVLPRATLVEVLVGPPPDAARTRDLMRAYDEWAVLNKPADPHSTADRLLIGAAVRLTRRPTPADVNDIILSLTSMKGIDPEVVEMIARRVRQKMGN